MLWWWIVWSALVVSLNARPPDRAPGYEPIKCHQDEHCSQGRVCLGGHCRCPFGYVLTTNNNGTKHCMPLTCNDNDTKGPDSCALEWNNAKCCEVGCECIAGYRLDQYERCSLADMDDFYGHDSDPYSMYFAIPLAVIVCLVVGIWCRRTKTCCRRKKQHTTVYRTQLRQQQQSLRDQRINDAFDVTQLNIISRQTSAQSIREAPPPYYPPVQSSAASSSPPPPPPLATPQIVWSTPEGVTPTQPTPNTMVNSKFALYSNSN